MTRELAVRYGVAAAAVAAILAVRWLLDPWLGNDAPLTAVALAVVASGWYGGLRPALFATALGTLGGWYLFIPERFSFVLRTSTSAFQIIVFLAIGACLSLLAWQMHRSMARSRRSEELFRRTLLDAPFPMMLHNEQGTVLAVNEAWTSITGYKPSDIPTIEAWTERAYGVEKDEVLAHIRGLYAAGKSVDSGERLVRTASGELRTWNFRNSPVGRDENGLRLLLTAAHDVTERTRMEQERASAAEKLQATIDSITDGLLLFDREWRYTYVSETAAGMLGVRSEDLVGGSVWELFPDARNRKFYTEYHKAVETGEPTHFEEFYPAPLNMWLECHCYPSVEGLSVYFRDVTERKLVEQRLRQRTAELNSLLENAPIGFAFFDREFRYVRMNQRLAEINGLPLEAHIGKTIREVIPVNAPAVEPILEHVFSTAEPVRTEIAGETPRQPGVTRFWATGFYPVFEGTQVVMVGAFVLETTEQRRTEQAMRESSERLQLALASARMGTFEIVLQTDELTWDQRSFELFRLAPDQPVTLANAMRQIHVADRQNVERAIASACDPASGGRYEAEYRLVWPDGSVRWMHSSGRVYFQGSRPVRLAGINHDVTERKEIEIALKESQERFRIAAAAAELGVFEWDFNTDEVILHDSRMREILGLRQDDEISKFASVLHPDDLSAFRTAIHESASNGGILRTTARVRIDDIDRWIRVEGALRRTETGAPSRLLAIAQDITEARRLEQQLKESEAYLTTVIENLPVGVSTTDRQGRILSMNEAGLRLHGFESFEQMLTTIDEYRTNFQLYSLDGQPLSYSQWPAARASRGEDVLEQEVILRRSDVPLERVAAYTAVRLPGDTDMIIYVIQDITARRAAEERLRASEAQYRTLFESIDEGFCVLEMYFDETGRAIDYKFLEANPAFERHTGIINGVGRKVSEIVPDLDESWFRIYGEVAVSGKAVRFENDAPAMGRSFDVYAFRIGAPEQRRVALLFNDISRRKQNERAVESARQEAESQRRLLDAVLESLPVGVIIADANGRLLRWNKANAALWGLHGVDPTTFESIEQYRKWKAWWPDSGRQLEAHEWAMSRALLHREIATGELVEIQPFDGSGRKFMVNMGAPVIDQSGNVIGAVVAQTDVTDRVAMERALRESEDKFRTISDNIPQLAWMAGENGHTLWHNQRWFEYTGSSSNGENVPFGALVHPEDAAYVKDRWEHSIRTGEQLEVEFRLRRFDGVYRWFLGRAIAIRDDTGRIVRWFGTNTGIQDQKMTEEALRRSNEDLQQFAYVASHDLQEPLRTVVSFSQLLSRRYSSTLDTEGRELLAYIRDGAIRMSFLVRDLLLYSRVTRDRERRDEQVPLEDVLKEVLQNLRSALDDAGARVEHDPMPVVTGDRMQLGQVFQNLISNALKYRREGVAPELQIRCRRHRTEWLISVADNGQGFDQEFADRIFGIFKRLHGRDVPGTGIGLAICKTVVERHGGRIWAESRNGTGSTFYVTLPVA